MGLNAAAEEMEQFYSRCLLCTCRPHVAPHLHIFSETGNQLQLADKINKLLNIQIKSELPQRVCHSCRVKLEVSHELATSSQRAQTTLWQIKQRWTSLGMQIKLDDEDCSVIELDDESQQPDINSSTTDIAVIENVAIDNGNPMDLQINEILIDDSSCSVENFDQSDSSVLHLSLENTSPETTEPESKTEQHPPDHEEPEEDQLNNLPEETAMEETADESLTSKIYIEVPSLNPAGDELLQIEDVQPPHKDKLDAHCHVALQNLLSCELCDTYYNTNQTELATHIRAHLEPKASVAQEEVSSTDKGLKKCDFNACCEGEKEEESEREMEQDGQTEKESAEESEGETEDGSKAEMSDETEEDEENEEYEESEEDSAEEYTDEDSSEETDMTVTQKMRKIGLSERLTSDLTQQYYKNILSHTRSKRVAENNCRYIERLLSFMVSESEVSGDNEKDVLKCLAKPRLVKNFAAKCLSVGMKNCSIMNYIKVFKDFVGFIYNHEDISDSENKLILDAIALAERTIDARLKKQLHSGILTETAKLRMKRALDPKIVDLAKLSQKMDNTTNVNRALSNLESGNRKGKFVLSVRNADWFTVTRYIAAAMSFKNFQRPGLVTNMTCGEFEKAIFVEETGYYVIYVLEHKTKKTDPAAVAIDKTLYDIMKRYYKIRKNLTQVYDEASMKKPLAQQNFLINSKLKKQVKGPQEVKRFQQQLNCSKKKGNNSKTLTSTDARIAIETAMFNRSAEEKEAVSQSLLHCPITAEKVYRCRTPQAVAKRKAVATIATSEIMNETLASGPKSKKKKKKELP